MFRRVLTHVAVAALIVLVGSCGGGGNGQPIDNGNLGVYTGFGGNLDWSTGGDGDGGGSGVGVGDGADGSGGVGAGGDFGQFRGVTVRVFKDDGTLLGEAPTDDVKGMVTIRPGRTYTGSLRIELIGGPNASYYEEGKGTFVPFPAGRTLRAMVPSVNKNIGVTPFTEAAYRLLTEGSTPERAGANPTAAQIRAANERVRRVLNDQFPSLLAVDDITRLPYIKSPAVAQGSLKNDPRGRYGVVNGAFSKQAAMFNSERTAPTLDATRQLAEDLLDGQLDGRNGNLPALAVAERTYDPNTLAGELSAALAQQAEQFASSEIQSVLPKVLNFGNTRYQGYLFDGSVRRDGAAVNTVAGWVGDNPLGRTVGQPLTKNLGGRAFGFIGNFGHGASFFKADGTGPRSRIFVVGDNVNGELGLGHRDATGSAAIEVTLPGQLTHAAGGFAHTVARMADGSVWAWGDNQYGQLGQGVDAGTLPSALAPQRVTLPVGAVSVAATSVASYALLEDGTVWAWGSNGGFALLGNGQRDGTALSPQPVAGLGDVVQISARDNDVVVLRRDNSVWHWGSHPAPVTGFVEGDATTPYTGGSLVPTQASGLPAGQPIRKVLTEQGLFAVLLGNGQVWTWGVYFDITADGILRDLAPQRVLGVPPLRDLMPGGFVGYGARPFDRLTAMGVDYRGGMWKVRGRVAEVFDPDNPTVQRRPQGQGPRIDCIACHTFLDESLEELVARRPPEQPTDPVCEPPTANHNSTVGSLIHAETECVQCHNPSRLNYPTQLPQPFAASGGWPNCRKPTNLPPRSGKSPVDLTTACRVPSAHPFTPPGTVCASCHNSVLARALQDLSPPCAQPESSDLPTIATTAVISGAFSGNAPIAAGGLTRDRTPQLRGTLSAALAGGQALAVLRNGGIVGNAIVSGTSWTFTDSTGDGVVTYAARVTSPAGFGRDSAPYSFTVDNTPPTATGTVTGFRDDVLGDVAIGGFVADTTPTMLGTLSAPLETGDKLQILRNAVQVSSARLNGTSWSYTELEALPPGTYAYQVRPVDAAGNYGATSASASVTIVGALPAVTIDRIVVSGGGSPGKPDGTVVAGGGAIPDATPTLQGSLGAALAGGQTVLVLRDGVPAGNASVSDLSWSFTDPGATDGVHVYTARSQAGVVAGSEGAAYTVVVDTAAPVFRPQNTSQHFVVADDFIGALANGATTSDTTPRLVGTVAVAPAAGESLEVLRNGAFVGRASFTTAVNWRFPDTLTNGTYDYAVRMRDDAGWLSGVSMTISVTIDTSAVPLPGAGTRITSLGGVSLPPTGGNIGVNRNQTPVLNGTIDRALASDEVVRVYRDTNQAFPAPFSDVAVVSGTGWTYSNTTLATGTYFFRARIEKTASSAIFGASSAIVSTTVDVTAPTQRADVTRLYDDRGPTAVDVTGSFSADTTPRIDGTLTAALAAGEVVRVYRGTTPIRDLTPSGLAWTTTDPAALAAGTYTYRAEVVDAATNVGPTTGSTASVTVLTSMPSTSIDSVSVSSANRPRPIGTLVANGGAISDTRPSVNVTISPALPVGHVLNLLRDGVSITTSTTCGSGCSLVDPGAAEGAHTYTARVEAGGVQGAAATYTVTVDVTAPPAPGIRGFVDNRPYQNTGNRNAPGSGQVSGELALTSGDAVLNIAPVIEVDGGSIAAGDQVVVLLDDQETLRFAGGASRQIQHPQQLNRANAAAPSTTTSFAARYNAYGVDAAGNRSDPAAVVFAFSMRYEACNQDRALSRVNNTGHVNWAAGTSTCTGCHSTPTAPGYVAAPPAGNRTGADPGYWCTR